jgi:signal transduction histidine kinase
MQTPLAVFRSKLDILLQQKDLTGEQSQIVQSLYKSVSRLVRINKNLLLLAKIDNQQFTDTQPLDVCEILNESLPLFSEQAEICNIKIEKRIPEGKTILHANRTLLESLIHNLLANAVKHNIPNGEILVSLNNLRLTITNTGINRSLNRENLFRRFSRMSGNADGSGLGLAIAQQIGLLYKWQIDYKYENQKHRFEVTF